MVKKRKTASNFCSIDAVKPQFPHTDNAFLRRYPIQVGDHFRLGRYSGAVNWQRELRSDINLDNYINLNCE